MENTIILNSGQKIDVLFQDNVTLDIDCALRYIKSGEAEINTYVNNVAKQKLDKVIDTAKEDMAAAISQGIEDAAALADTRATIAVNNSITGAISAISDYVSANITPQLDTAAADFVADAALKQVAVDASKNAAAASAVAAASSASDALDSAVASASSASEALNSATAASSSASAAQEALAKLNNGWNLFDAKFADHRLQHISWLPADDFAWHSGAVYADAYHHLSDELADAAAASETIAGITVDYWRAADGHKIVLAENADTVAAIFAATGVAWYYILDTNAERFKLPRTRYGINGLRDAVGDFVPESLPNITGQYPPSLLCSINAEVSATGALTALSCGQWSTDAKSGSGDHAYTLGIDASLSSPAYQDDAAVQPRSTQMRLYFYVGSAIQDTSLITAGGALEDIAELKGEVLRLAATKAEVDLSNCTQPHIIATYRDGYNFYRMYSDGWVEQGGYAATNNTANVTVNLLTPFADTSYAAVVTFAGAYREQAAGVDSKTETKFVVKHNANSGQFYWRAFGFADLT
ncbi:MAG: hypothetical protein IJ529_00180 [Alphaproteobacteria bacterium]|nr:hypothetical protein [Alphaproteobacteria bacterium]MBQ9235124.1 hypothetical protein [Alphaproteobacteria bacterium]